MGFGKSIEGWLTGEIGLSGGTRFGCNASGKCDIIWVWMRLYILFLCRFSGYQW